MFKFLLESAPDIQIFAVAALLLFFSLFSIAIFWAIRADKRYIHHLKYLPLESETQDGDILHDEKK